jgi:hypothetical protein
MATARTAVWGRSAERPFGGTYNRHLSARGKSPRLEIAGRRWKKPGHLMMLGLIFWIEMASDASFAMHIVPPVEGADGEMARPA